MKPIRLFVLALALPVFVVATANAQQARYPAAVRPVGYNHGLYSFAQPPGVEASPSDVPQPPQPNGGQPIPPAPPANGNGDDHENGGCDDECDEEDECDECDEEEEDCSCPCYLFGPDEAWELSSGDNCWKLKVGGWFEAGYVSDNVPLSVERNDGLSFRDVPDDFLVNQAWIYFERAAEGDCCCWDYGYRVDIMYGTDAAKTQAFGNELDQFGNPRRWDNPWDHGIYGWAIPQAYFELAKGDLSVIAGHFYTLVGYEVVTAPDNFFYTHALTMFNSEPFTHTGVLGTYGVNDNLEAYFGWTLGWDTGFDQFQDGNNWLGGFSATLTEDVTFTYISTAGNLGFRGENGYTHSVVIDVVLTDCLEYVLQGDLVSIKVDDINGGSGNDQVGINQYLFYTYNDCVKFGTRLEWWKSDGVSFHEVTGGVNIKPHANMIIRPEVRYDWQGNLVDANDQPVGDVTTFGIDVIFTF